MADFWGKAVRQLFEPQNLLRWVETWYPCSLSTITRLEESLLIELAHHCGQAIMVEHHEKPEVSLHTKVDAQSSNNNPNRVRLCVLLG